MADHSDCGMETGSKRLMKERMSVGTTSPDDAACPDLLPSLDEVGADDPEMFWKLSAIDLSSSPTLDQSVSLPLY